MSNRESNAQGQKQRSRAKHAIILYDYVVVRECEWMQCSTHSSHFSFAVELERHNKCFNLAAFATMNKFKFNQHSCLASDQMHWWHWHATVKCKWCRGAFAVSSNFRTAFQFSLTPKQKPERWAPAKKWAQSAPTQPPMCCIHIYIYHYMIINW